MGELKAHASEGREPGTWPSSSRCGPRTSSCPSRPACGRRWRKRLPGHGHAKDFLGEYLDFQVKVGDVVLQARAHPSLRTPTGDPIYVRMKADKCVAIRDATIARKSVIRHRRSAFSNSRRPDRRALNSIDWQGARHGQGRHRFGRAGEEIRNRERDALHPLGARPKASTSSRRPYVRNLRTVELKPWARRGGNAVLRQPRRLAHLQRQLRHARFRPARSSSRTASCSRR